MAADSYGIIFPYCSYLAESGTAAHWGTDVFKERSSAVRKFTVNPFIFFKAPPNFIWQMLLTHGSCQQSSWRSTARVRVECSNLYNLQSKTGNFKVLKPLLEVRRVGEAPNMHQPYPAEQGKGTITTALKTRDNQAVRSNYQALFRFRFNIFRYQAILNKHTHTMLTKY